MRGAGANCQPPRANRAKKGIIDPRGLLLGFRIPPGVTPATSENEMRFLGKYELLEQLTVGRVETFSAYPIGGGERILVHVFPLPALIKSAPTNRDLLDYMQELSPPALGAVLDAGRYDDGSQAYVVIKFPRDLDALPKWVEAYKSMTKSHDTTAEVPAPELWDTGNGDT